MLGRKKKGEVFNLFSWVLLSVVLEASRRTCGLVWNKKACSHPAVTLSYNLQGQSLCVHKVNFELCNVNRMQNSYPKNEVKNYVNFVFMFIVSFDLR